MLELVIEPVVRVIPAKVMPPTAPPMVPNGAPRVLLVLLITKLPVPLTPPEILSKATNPLLALFVTVVVPATTRPPAKVKGDVLLFSITAVTAPVVPEPTAAARLVAP